MDFDVLSVGWVTKAYIAGMQRLASEPICPFAVEVVAEKRMSEMREMDADLMRTPRGEAQREERQAACLNERRIVRDGALSFGGDHALDDAAPPACDGQINRAARLGQDAFDDGEVDALDCVMFG